METLERPVEAWDTGWDEFIVRGTHAPDAAIAAVRGLFVLDVGEYLPHIDGMLPPQANFITAGKVWGPPDVPAGSSELTLSTYPADGLIPYMVVAA
jgi:hypothetical protein